MKTRVIRSLSLAACLFGCGGNKFTAIEMNMDADLRVVIAVPSTGQKVIAILGRDEPFQYPLKDLFSRDGQSLKVAIVAFSTASIIADIPSLQGKTAADLKTILKPDFGTPAAGAYDIPPPLRVLTATLKQGGSSDVNYQPITVDALKMDPDLRFIFKIDAPIACAPGANDIRVFNRDDPSKVCVFHRDDGCAWRPSQQTACSNISQIIFGAGTSHTVDGTSLREVPPRTLVDDKQLHCESAQDLALGETRRFDCTSSGGKIVSVQETPRTSGGNAWVPTILTVATISSMNGIVATSEEGALYAYPGIELSRIKVDNGQLFVQPILYKNPSGTGGFMFTIPRFQVGELVRMSLNVSHTLATISGTKGGAVFERDNDVGVPSGEQLTYYKHPATIIDLTQIPEVVTATRVGDLVQSRIANGVVLLISTGLLRIAVNTESHMFAYAGQTATSTFTFDRAQHPRLVIAKERDDERAVVWLDSGDVYVFMNVTPVLHCRFAPETVLLAYDGPSLIVRDPVKRFTIHRVDLAAAETMHGCSAALDKVYYVPPNRQDLISTTDIQMDLDAHGASTREILVYRYESDVGDLDLASGASQAITVPEAPMFSAEFDDVGKSAQYAVVGRTDSTRLISLFFPFLMMDSQ